MLDRVCVRSAGHPPPILAGRGALVDRLARSPLGVDLGRRDLPGTSFDLPATWSLVAYTDGLFEVRDAGSRILDSATVPEAVAAARVDGQVDPDRLIADFASRGDGWRDDVAVMVVGRHEQGRRAS